MGRLTRFVTAVSRNMWGLVGGAFLGLFVLGLLTPFWSFVNGIDAVVIRVGAAFVIGAAISLVSSSWVGTSGSVAVGAGFLAGAFAGGAAGLVVVGVAVGAALGGLVGVEIHRPYDNTFKK